jgi:hypothetical protein
MTSGFDDFDGVHDPEEAEQHKVSHTPNQDIDLVNGMVPSFGDCDGQRDDSEVAASPRLPPPDYQSCILTSGIDTAMLVHGLCIDLQKNWSHLTWVYVDRLSE